MLENESTQLTSDTCERNFTQNVIVAAVILFVAVYLVITFGLFEFKRWRKENDDNNTFVYKNICSRGTLPLMGSVCAVIQCTFLLFEVTYGHKSDSFCRSYLMAQVLCYVSIAGSYITVLIRIAEVCDEIRSQYGGAHGIFFNERTLFVFFWIVAACIIPPINLISEFQFKSSSCGCVLPTKPDFVKYPIFPLFFIGSIIILMFGMCSLGKHITSEPEEIDFRKEIMRILFSGVIFLVATLAMAIHQSQIKSTSIIVAPLSQVPISISLAMNIATASSYSDSMSRFIPCYRKTQRHSNNTTHPIHETIEVYVLNEI